MPEPVPVAMTVERPALAASRDKGGALVAVRGESERHPRERLAALRRTPEGKPDGEIRPLDEILGVREEIVHYPPELRARRPEAGGREVTQGAGDFGLDDGGDHEGGGL